MPVTVDQFAKHLEDSGILAPGEVKALQTQKKFKDAQDFARELIRQQKLTKFQAEAVYKGNGQNLIVGNYVLLDRIGAGGMGEVYRGRHKTLGRMAALKVIKKEKLQSSTAVRRFQREIQAASKLNHPNIVRAFDADEIGGTLLFAMEFVDGTDLSKLVKKHGPLPVDKACDYIRQSAIGLQHAREAGNLVFQVLSDLLQSLGTARSWRRVITANIRFGYGTFLVES